MACCFAVVVLKSRNQTVKAAEADVWAGRAESLFERLLLQADIIFSLNSVAFIDSAIELWEHLWFSFNIKTEVSFAIFWKY